MSRREPSPYSYPVTTSQEHFTEHVRHDHCAADISQDNLAEHIGDAITHIPFVIGIDGRSGAGKTRLARALERWLTHSRTVGGRRIPLRVAVVELELFIEGWNGLITGTHRVAHDILVPFRTHGTATATPWDWNTYTWSTTPTTISADVLILVGCGSTSAACAPHLDLSIWIEAPADLRRERVEYRETQGSGVDTWWNDWATQEAALLAERNSPTHADMTISNTEYRPSTTPRAIRATSHA